jgi:hypothetical protein
VDGIDKFQGDPSVIAKLFRPNHERYWNRGSRPRRPLSACELAFASCPQTRVQDLTYDDIKKYVHDHFNDDEPLLTLAIDDVNALKGLVDQIIAKADGVFLWILLMVVSLLSGLESADGIKDLEKQL